MENHAVKKANGTIEIISIPDDIEIDSFIRKIREENKNICDDCANCHRFLCEKVSGLIKQNIRRYEFIDEGIQVYDGNNIMRYFLVIKCKNFEEKIRRTLLKKENGLVEVIELPEDFDYSLYKQDSNIKHLCTSCANCRADLCEKVANMPKTRIDKYDFIDTGSQTYDNNGNMDYFGVSKCLNYKIDRRLVK